MDMNLSKLWETVKDRKVWRGAIHGVTKSFSDFATKQQEQHYLLGHKLWVRNRGRYFAYI